MNDGYRITTEPFANGDIVQTIDHERADGVRDQVLRIVMKTAEQQTRDALIRLGWTPPTSAPVPDTAHEWVGARSVGLDRGWTVCKNCGIVRNATSDSRPCRGKVSVALRASR